MRKKVIAICMCFTMLFGMLLVNNMGVKAEGDIESQEQEVKDAFEISVTPRNAMEAGKEVTFDICIKNTTNKELRDITNIVHECVCIIGDEKYSPKQFGDWYNEEGKKMTAENLFTIKPFAPGTSQTHKLIGTLPDDWGRKYFIDIHIYSYDYENKILYSGSTEYNVNGPVQPTENEWKNLNYQGYTLDVTAENPIKAGEPADFQINITNRSGVVQKVSWLNHFYHSDNRKHELYPSADFGILKDKQGNTITEEEALEIVFQPDETKEFTLTGTIPEDWNEYGRIMVEVISYGENGIWYETMAEHYQKRSSIKDELRDNMNFSDINENEWYYEAAKYVYERGIMTGTTATEFSPGGILSRAQFATIIYRIEEEPEAEYDGTAFPDVADGAFYTSPAMWAKSSGVIGGYQDGRFGPADDITREQMAVMMYRYAEMLGLDTSARGNMGEFPDAGQVSPFAAEAMKWAVGTGLIRGDQGMIHPQGGAQRDQCATIVMRFMDEVYSDYF